MGKEKSGTRRK